MRATYALTRTLVAPLFLSGGLSSVRNPEAKAAAAKSTSEHLTKMGLPIDPITLVRMNGVLQLGAGLLLVCGKVPRLASAALAASLVPTTFAGHRFWEESDPQLRSTQKIQFMKNFAILGGLVLLATDTNGAPSLSWRINKTASKAAQSVNNLGKELGVTSGSVVSTAVEHLKDVSERVAATAAPLLEMAKSTAPSLRQASSATNALGKASGAFVDQVVHSLAQRVSKQ